MSPPACPRLPHQPPRQLLGETQPLSLASISQRKGSSCEQEHDSPRPPLRVSIFKQGGTERGAGMRQQEPTRAGKADLAVVLVSQQQPPAALRTTVVVGQPRGSDLTVVAVANSQ